MVSMVSVIDGDTTFHTAAVSAHSTAAVPARDLLSLLNPWLPSQRLLGAVAASLCLWWLIFSVGAALVA